MIFFAYIQPDIHLTSSWG